MLRKFAKPLIFSVSLATLPVTLPGQASAAGAQYFPLQSYRVGPYAAGGTGFFGGFIDYMQLINLRDGGVNGVKLTWSECETEDVVEKRSEERTSELQSRENLVCRLLLERKTQADDR